jgi:hypothetical protein
MEDTTIRTGTVLFSANNNGNVLWYKNGDTREYIKELFLFC